jgi:hypothetical protein
MRILAILVKTSLMDVPYDPVRIGLQRHALVLSVAFGIVGCGGGERPKEIVVSNVAIFRPDNPDNVKTIEQALAAIITVCRDDLGLPVTDPLYVRLYKNSESFAYYGHRQSNMPEIVAGFTRQNEIHLNLEKVDPGPWGPSITLVAHEYAHTVYYQVVGRDDPNSFLSEGFADWVAARVLHFLGWRDYTITLYQTKKELSRNKNLVPDISSLRDNRFWERTLQAPMAHLTAFKPAFLAMDRLVQRQGLPATIQFLRNGDVTGIFEKLLEEFGRDLKNSHLGVTSPEKGKFLLSQPQWGIGYKWTYRKRSFGKFTPIIKELYGEDIMGRIPVFVVKSDEEEKLYAKEGLALLGIRRNGELILRLDKGQEFFSWPLRPGKEWRNSFTQQNIVDNSTDDYDRLLSITGIEHVQVPVGDFEAVKIEAYGVKNGRLQAEYWYSPQVKWFVKTRTYSHFGVTEEELLRVDLDGAKRGVN